MNHFDRAWARPPMLLANPSFFGTLGATRTLGEQGVPVYSAGNGLLDLSRWSRYTTRALACPAIDDCDRFLDWLVDLGAREPGIVLYPTSDETAFLYALRGAELARTFRTYQPSLEAILAVLDKKRLYAHARAVGMDVPDTWFPESIADVERIAREIDPVVPLLVKPRTQVLSNTHSKGIIVRDRAQLRERYEDLVRHTVYGPTVLEHFPEAPHAMLQRYLPEGSDEIYVLAAFLDHTGQHFAARSAMKIFQRPRSLGIGLCFEEAPLDETIADAARRLALASGYHGLFQLEFIKVGGRFLLIDFNPRFYNQLAFDVARGLPLPQLVYAAALGHDDEVARMIATANEPRDDERLVFCNDFGLETMLVLQRIAGRMTRDETTRWRTWQTQNRARAIDPARVRADPMPGYVDVVAQLYGYARHPRAFVRKIVLDHTPP